MNEEQIRLNEYNTGNKNWMHWGCYLSERQWGTVREDYSAKGDAWNFFTYQQAVSRVYRWGEDGIAGICDEQQYLCFAPSFWNGKDPILKERLFGLTNAEGNHGEDVKELYYYLDNTPTHSYMKYLYKYPQAEFPYNELLTVNRNRGKDEPEYELLDTGVFNDHKYFDIETEYAKADEDDILIQINVTNCANEPAKLYLLPTLWFRNTWKFGLTSKKVEMTLQDDGMCIKTKHEKIPNYYLYFQSSDKVLFTENKNNKALLWGTADKHPFRKDAFHKAVIQNDYAFLENKKEGTKAAPLYELNLAAHETTTICLRLCTKKLQQPFNGFFNETFETRKKEANLFYEELRNKNETLHHANLRRQALAGMLWSKQFYYYNVAEWLKGDNNQPEPPAQRWQGRNSGWQNFKAADIISMPDKWEYPWFAAWDLAFHTIAIAEVDIEFAKKQLLLLFGKNYISDDGQLPAYEWNFSDVNPPVQSIAALEICKIEKNRFDKIDLGFLKTIFPLLLKNYNWWLRREDDNHNNVFEGGFLGLDNISIFDRTNGLPEGARLDQADGTAWMALFSLNMMEIALILAEKEKKYEEDCITFFNHFVKIANSLHHIAAVWADDDVYDDGFFYDILHFHDGRTVPVKLRSIAGIIPLLAALCINNEQLKNTPRLKKILQNFEHNKCRYQIVDHSDEKKLTILSLLTPHQLKHLLPVLFEEKEMLAPGGIRSISKVYENGFVMDIDGKILGLNYKPGESDNGMYGGNSNWRGPIWMPLNYLIVRALNTYGNFYEKDIEFNFSGKEISIAEGATELSRRLMGMFLPGDKGNRPIHGEYDIYQTKHFEDLILFYEHFHAETSHGIGASHQTGWTGLAALL